MTKRAVFHNLRWTNPKCSSKAKMSALGKVEMSVSPPLGGSEAVISMGMVVMSKRELNRLDVLARLDSDKLAARAAAELMAMTLGKRIGCCDNIAMAAIQPSPTSGCPRTTGCRM